MNRIGQPPWWAVVSSLAAPVLLIGGWLLAQAVQPGDFDAVIQTISALAAEGTPHRWVMTAGFVGVGVAHLVTAAGLSVLRPLSRATLALAGVATLGVAAFPLHSGGSSAHGVTATIAFVALALWPATTAARRTSWVVHPAVAFAVTAVSAALLVTFAAKNGGATRGAWERAVAAQQVLWPLVVVLALRAGARMRA